MIAHFKRCLGAGLLGLVPLVAACSKAPAAAETVRPAYNKEGKLTRLEYDSNGDGKVDTWGYMDGARLVRVEVDENGDGKIDRWEYHGAGAGSGEAGDSGGSIDRIERATRHDGRVSRREFFEKGVLSRVEEDTDGDGKIDKWETYIGGALSMMALDSHARGTPDRRLIYRPDGKLDRIEADPDGSGHFQPLPLQKP